MKLEKRKCHFCGEMKEVLTHRGLHRICTECRMSVDQDDPVEYGHGDPHFKRDYGGHKPPRQR